MPIIPVSRGTPFVKGLPMYRICLYPAAVLIAVSLSLPSQAFGQQTMICGQREQIIAQLHSRFGEERRSMGLAGRNRILEVYASEQTGSWTITIIGVDGITCLLASGQNYESFAPVAPGQNL